MKYRILGLLLALALPLMLTCGCGRQEEPPPEDTPVKIGVSMPNDTDAKWAADSITIRDQLTASGFEVDLRFAGDSAGTQVEQLQAMIDAGCTTLIVAAVDPAALSSAFRLEQEGQETKISGGSAGSAQAETEAPQEDAPYNSTPIDDGITVIAYDKLITNCNAVDYYVGFDGYEAGYLQARYIEDQLSLYDTTETYNIEFFFGGVNSAWAGFQYEGAMEVLQVYIDSGVLQVPSGQTALEDCAADGYEAAAARMSGLLSSCYQGVNLDAVLCANDQLAQGVSDAVFSGYTGGVYPILSGLGCEEQSVNHLLSGRQGMTLLEDYTGMAEEAADVAAAFASGSAPETSDSLDNGRVNVPASLFYPEEVFASNVGDLLIGRGYFADNGDGTLRSITDYTRGAAVPAEADAPEPEPPAEADPPEPSPDAAPETGTDTPQESD